MKLYFNKFSRASRVRWMLEELGVPHDLVVLDMRAGEHRDASKNPHPLLKVPALEEEDGTVLIESHSIVVHLADQYADRGLIPPSGKRGRFYQWCFFAQVTLEPEIYAVFTHESRLPEAERIPAVAAAARSKFKTLLGPLRDQLSTTPYLLGDAFMACDILIAGALIWAKGLGMLEGETVLLEYADRCAARPARLRALA